jgi:hypothetical protein
MMEITELILASLSRHYPPSGSLLKISYLPPPLWFPLSGTWLPGALSPFPPARLFVRALAERE